ncbi:MAG: guanylate kinase [candidate division Zixibacteria bacterium]|nr:guanylate kinase [candidate division Zixibacteria bacterium]
MRLTGSRGDTRRINRPKPLLVVFSAPSGAGKSTIVDLLARGNRSFCKSISATTRPRRKGERGGRHYFFLSREEFRSKQRRKKFIETAEVFGEWYGTPRGYVLHAEAAGKTVLFDIDIQGGMAVKKWRRDAVLIFVLPPSIPILRQRLRRRESETAAAIELRLACALKEIKYWSKYDYVVVNDELDETVALISKIIRAESQRTSRLQAADSGL